MIKKHRSFITFLLAAITFNACAMEQKKALGWVALAGGVIIGAVALKQFLSYIHSEPITNIDPFPFTELPKDERNNILGILTTGANAESLKIAAYTIKQLGQVNQELNNVINDEQFCLKTIKHLAQRFNCSNETAARALGTPAARRRLQLQMILCDMCYKKDYPVTVLRLKNIQDLPEKGLDLEFTYNERDMFFDFLKVFLTPLMIASIQGNIPMINALLRQGSNINQSTNKGMTALMLAAACSNATLSIKELVAYPNLEINQQAQNGNTALMCAITGGSLDNDIKTVEILLNAGADPELPNNDGITPLEMAQERKPFLDPVAKIQQLINLIQDAIIKKYSKK